MRPVWAMQFFAPTLEALERTFRQLEADLSAPRGGTGASRSRVRKTVGSTVLIRVNGMCDARDQRRSRLEAAVFWPLRKSERFRPRGHWCTFK